MKKVRSTHPIAQEWLNILLKFAFIVYSDFDNSEHIFNYAYWNKSYLVCLIKTVSVAIYTDCFSNYTCFILFFWKVHIFIL